MNLSNADARITRLSNLAAAVLAGTLAGAAVPVAADDTDIYVGVNAARSGVRPNIMFILDTSGSMGNTDGKSSSRMRRMQDAFKQVLTNLSGVNAGVMRFHQWEGGPVVYPITDIALGIEAPMLYRVSRDGDDGEELLSTGAVSLDGQSLNLGVPDDDAPAGITSKSYTSIVRNGANMAERRVKTIKVEQDDDLENDAIASRGPGESYHHLAGDGVAPFVSMRFDQLPNDLADARIDTATLQLMPYADFSSEWRLLMRGHTVASEPPLPALTDVNEILCQGTSILDYNQMDALCRHRRIVETAGWQGVESIEAGFGGTARQPMIFGVKHLLQSVVTTPGFTSTSLGFSTGALKDDGDQLSVYGNASGVPESYRPALNVTYTPGAAGGQYARPRRVALRFRDVRIPQGAKINDVRLEFTPLANSADPMDLRVSFVAAGRESGAGSLERNEFTTSNQSLSTIKGPGLTPTTVMWTVGREERWTAFSSVVTPNLQSALEPIVEQTDWCGGHDIIAFIDPAKAANPDIGSRSVSAVDYVPSANEAYSAPRLRIQLAPDLRQDYGAGEGCTVSTTSLHPGTQFDDARVDEDGKDFDNTGNILDADRDFIGMRFPNVPIPAEAAISKANLYVRSRRDYEYKKRLSTRYRLFTDASADSPSFSSKDVGPHSRTPSPTKVDSNLMPPGAVESNEEMLLADVRPLITEAIARPNWQDGNAISIIGATTYRDEDIEFHSFDFNPSSAPRLEIEYQFNMGDLSVTRSSGVTVKEHLTQLVDDFTPDGDTPTVDAYFEAARYFRGERVHYGLTRAGHHDREYNTANDSYNSYDLDHARLSRVSHPGSYSSGTVVRDPDCQEVDYNAYDCHDERIDGLAQYSTPIDDACQGNYIVLLTDGRARQNHRTDLEADMIGIPSCQSTFSDGTAVSQGQLCGVDIARFLATKDQSPLPGKDPQTVITHTIAFEPQITATSDSTKLLKEMAKAGGGKYKEASSAQDLETVFNNLFATITGSKSFTPPALSTSAFNDLYTDEHVYLSMFEPSLQQAWNGNLKKYGLCHSSLVAGDPTANGCRIGEVIDAKGNAATDSQGAIDSEGYSLWTGIKDGAKVELGGIVGQLRAETKLTSLRSVYTYTDTLVAPQNKTGASKGQLHMLRDDESGGTSGSSGNGIIDYLETTAGLSEDAARIQTGRLMGMPATTDNELASINDTIRWARGEDTENEAADVAPAASDIRFAMGDPLHASPVVVNYGVIEGTGNEPDQPLAKLFVPSNDGAIRMVDATSGIEEWAFYPQATLSNQNTLREGRFGNHLYGLDSTPVAWIKDVNKDNVIDPVDGDRVRLIFGMRRGGTHYYAIDVTPSAKLTTAHSNAANNPSIEPKYLWRIDGGEGEFPRLGQTWSRPRLGKVRVGRVAAPGEEDTEARVALVFGGGYDPVQDDGFGPTGSGNAIYVVDAETGKRLFFASGAEKVVHGLGAGVKVPGMEFPIPSDTTVVDVDGDGAIDRILVGDTGGQIWRLDIRAKAGFTDGVEGVIGRIASTAFSKTIADFSTLAVEPEDERKFFYSPGYHRISGNNVYSSTSNYDLVVVGSGNRADPLNENQRNRLFFLRDTRTSSLFKYDEDDNGIADGMKPGTGAASSKTIFTGVSADLDGGDIVSIGALQAPAVPATPDANGQLAVGKFIGGTAAALQTKQGFAAELTTDGEKALARPLLIAGKVVFTTYLPLASKSAALCGGAEGGGRLHILNLLNGASANDSVELGSGIPSQPAVFFRNLGKPPGPNDPDATVIVGTGGGAGSFNMDGLLDNPNRNSFGGSYRQIGDGDRQIEFGLYWYEDPDN